MLSMDCTRKGRAERPWVAAIVTATDTTPEPFLHGATASILICPHEKQSLLLGYNDMLTRNLAT